MRVEVFGLFRARGVAWVMLQDLKVLFFGKIAKMSVEMGDGGDWWKNFQMGSPHCDTFPSTHHSNSNS